MYKIIFRVTGGVGGKEKILLKEREPSIRLVSIASNVSALKEKSMELEKC